MNVGIAEQNMVGMAAGMALLAARTVFTANAAPSCSLVQTNR